MKKRVKILHLISTLDVGGAEQNLFRLVTAMDRAAFENHVACMISPGVLGRSLELEGIPVYSLKMKKGMPDLRAMLRLRFMASLMRPDIVQCWMYHANLLGLALAKPAKTLWGIRCSDMDLSAYGLLYRLTVRAGARLSHLPRAVVVNSDAGRETHSRMGYHPREWVTIPNGFDTSLFRPDAEARLQVRAELQIPESAPVVGLVARLDPMKDHGTFFRAAALLLEKNPDVRFVLAGKGVASGEPPFKGMIPVGHTGKFSFLGERHDIPRVLSAIDILTSSSVSEGFPNAVGEAMATGVPCAVTDAGDSAALVGETGIVVGKKDPQALCAALLELLDHNRRQPLGGQARKRIILHYSLESMKGRYEELYAGIMEARRS